MDVQTNKDSSFYQKFSPMYHNFNVMLSCLASKRKMISLNALLLYSDVTVICCIIIRPLELRS